MGRRSALFGTTQNIENDFIKNFIEGNNIDVFYNDKITKVAPYKFYKCNIETVYLPNVTEVKDWGFLGSQTSKIKRLFLPNLTTFSSAAKPFSGNQNLSVFSTGQQTLLLTMFDSSTLEHLILTSSQKVPVEGSGTQQTLIRSFLGSKTIYLYVPRTLISSYEEDWGQDSGVLGIRAIEDIRTLYSNEIYGVNRVPSFKNINNSFIKNFIEGNTIQNFYNSKITKIAPYKFYGNSIKEISLPNVISAGAYAFQGFSSGTSNPTIVERMFLPKIKSPTTSLIFAGNFMFNQNLKVLEIGYSQIPWAGLRYGNSLKHLILTSNSEVQIWNGSTITDITNTLTTSTTPIFQRGEGIVYVPDNLVEIYQNSEYWNPEGGPTITFKPISSINYNTIGKEE